MSWQEKRAVVFARLEAKTAERAAVRQVRRAASEGVSDQVEEFWARMHAEEEALTAAMDASVERGAMADADAAQALVDQWLLAIEGVRKLVADHTLLLPSYDLEHAQQLIAKLQAALAEAKGKILPRKKFAFRKREAVAPAGSTDAATPVSDASPDGAGGGAGGGGGGSGGSSEGMTPGSTPSATPLAPLSTPSEAASVSRLEHEEGFEGRKDEVIVVSSDPRLAGDPRVHAIARGKDLRLANLERCTVLILDVTRAVRVDNLVACHVLAGPIAGSVLLHGCTDCVFQFCSRQIRLHTSTRCAFFLRVFSRPIIEHCTELRFAPYSLTYDGWAAHLRDAGLHVDHAADPAKAERLEKMWREVDDFGWHKLQRSPNWSEVEDDAERARVAALRPEVRALGVSLTTDGRETLGGEAKSVPESGGVERRCAGEGEDEAKEAVATEADAEDEL